MSAGWADKAEHDGQNAYASTLRPLAGAPPSPCRRLLQAVLDAGLGDLDLAAKRPTVRNLTAAHEAWDWFHDNTDAYGSVTMVCAVLGLDVGALRKTLTKPRQTPPRYVPSPCPSRRGRAQRQLFCIHCHRIMPCAVTTICRRCGAQDRAA